MAAHSAGSLGNHFIATGLLVFLPILAKIPLLFGWLQSNPLLIYSGLQHSIRPGPFGGLPTIDPNIGFTSHALGRRAALDVLSGHIPWWNPFEGIGAPLAGGMQSAALFPLTWLLALPQGQLYEHIVLQIIAGLATYGLLRKLALARLPAFIGAALFAFNGTFAWLGNAVINPIAFLPVVLLGIEIATSRAKQGRAGGMALITLGLAASLYAGFPEVAYLNGLLAAVWTLLRLATAESRAIALRLLVKVGAGGIAGLAIAAPILIAFFDYLPMAEVGDHHADGFLFQHLSPVFLALMGLPYLLGGIFAGGPDQFWGTVGGYSGCGLLALAVAGLFGRRQRSLRLLLGGWTLVALGLTYGVAWLGFVVAVVPGFSIVALFRYLPASWSMCLCVLAALACDDLMATGRRRAIVIGAAVLLAALAVALFLFHAGGYSIRSSRTARLGDGVAVACFVAAISIIGWPRLSARFRTFGLGAVVLAEAIILFMIPVMATPRSGVVEQGGISFLQKNIGLGRIATLGPISPNYGSYFGVAEVNHNDLPVPRAWVDYVKLHLDPFAHPILFIGFIDQDPAAPPTRITFLAHQDQYAAIGVRYLVGLPDTVVPKESGLTQVFEDQVMRIFALPNSAPYFSASGCILDIADRESVTATCAAPAELSRLELWMPGWGVSVNDMEQELRRSGEVFQSVSLPLGRSVVRFRFEPPFMAWGYVLALCGLLALVLPFARRTQRGTPAAGI